MKGGFSSVADVSAYLIDENPIPVSIITGFLGSGKTTLLARILKSSIFSDTAVIVNELGEMGLDHLLLEVADEQLALLSNGCLCCQLRNDLVDTMRTLLDRATRSEIPAFERLVIETTGIADPVPIIQTLMTDPLRFSRFQFAGLSTVIDGVLGAQTLENFSVSVKQTALADCLIVSKMDVAENYKSLQERIRNINSTAPIIFSSNGEMDPRLLPGFGDSKTTQFPVISGEVHKPAHGDGIFEVSRAMEGPMDFRVFEKWVNQLHERYRGNLLRLKGIIHFEGQEAPSVIQAVQHILYPLETVSFQSEGEIGRLVLIGQEISRHELVSSLEDLAQIAYH
jgi:G3E family GTPase